MAFWYISLYISTYNWVIFSLKLLKHSERDTNMPGRRTRSYTLEEVTMIVIDVPDSDISDFEGKDGGDASDLFEPSLDSGDSNS